MAPSAKSVPVNRLTQSLGIVFSGVTTGGGGQIVHVSGCCTKLIYMRY